MTGVHGVRGELKVRPWCDGADFLLPFRRFALELPGGGEKRVRRTEGARPHQGFLLLKLEGVDTREDAQALRGCVLYFDRAEASLPEGTHFLSDLLGLTAVDPDGAEIGTLTEVLQPPAHDVYRITGPDGAEHWVPAVPEFVKRLDIENRRVVVALIEGM
ncbi:MAG: ribosome maturation factor RimM [Oscillospiraceae bacterium]|nr:ribosome maturation factor RimM [Oscillospiraceae bacterium]